MKIQLYILLISNFILTNLIFADTIILKDGTVLQGVMKSATEFTIMFEVDGELKEYKINDVTNITFTPRVEPVSTETSVVGTGVLIIPANTKITARTDEDISTKTHPEGSKVTAALELDIIIKISINFISFIRCSTNTCFKLIIYFTPMNEPSIKIGL